VGLKFLWFEGYINYTCLIVRFPLSLKEKANSKGGVQKKCCMLCVSFDVFMLPPLHPEDRGSMDL
jgi:hypothetical protein